MHIQDSGRKYVVAGPAQTELERMTMKLACMAMVLERRVMEQGHMEAHESRMRMDAEAKGTAPVGMEADLEQKTARGQKVLETVLGTVLERGRAGT